MGNRKFAPVGVNEDIPIVGNDDHVQRPILKSFGHFPFSTHFAGFENIDLNAAICFLFNFFFKVSGCNVPRMICFAAVC